MDELESKGIILNSTIKAVFVLSHGDVAKIFIPKFFITALSNISNFTCPKVFMGFPCGSADKGFACNVGDLGSIPGLGRSPGEGNWLPTPVFWPGEFHGLYSPWDHKESDMTEWLSLLLSFKGYIFDYHVSVIRSTVWKGWNKKVLATFLADIWSET